ncbi:hypothetical protein HY933_02830 [Candidatus Falkowbacteria bacterium]|nr:hypothetical protein [Candidatus Falkowbacteria bacterium]
MTVQYDLHFHSSHSDGKLSIAELAAMIKEKLLIYCAVADHDTVAGVWELQNCLAGAGATVIPATELTAKYGNNEVHLLAYDFDISAMAAVLAERHELVDFQRIKEMAMAIQQFRAEGFIVDKNLLPVVTQPIGLTVVLALCANSLNQEIFIQRHGKPFVPEDVFYAYQAPGKPCATERSGVTVEWLVDRVKNIVHDLIIAHPFVSVSVVTKPLDEAELKKLLDMGITGVEVYHHDTSDEQIKFLEQFVREHGLHYTGGSDSHGREKNTPLGQYGVGKVIPGFCLTNYASIRNSEIAG